MISFPAEIQWRQALKYVRPQNGTIFIFIFFPGKFIPKVPLPNPRSKKKKKTLVHAFDNLNWKWKRKIRKIIHPRTAYLYPNRQTEPSHTKSVYLHLAQSLSPHSHSRSSSTPATSPVKFWRHFHPSGHGKRMRRRRLSSCRFRALTTSPIPTFSATRTPPESCPESRRSVLPTSIPLRGPRKSRSPDLSNTSAASFRDAITFLGSNPNRFTPWRERNLLHGFSR